ncbi:MAG: Flp1 family type IVb pilin [Lachnospiraceae bacterium]|nr:Flp1 family type IVb pilin [Lachnospiraceae bacterium]
MGEVCTFLREEDGIAVVEIVLILIVLIAMVVLFRDQIKRILKSLMDKAESESGNV